MSQNKKMNNKETKKNRVHNFVNLEDFNTPLFNTFVIFHPLKRPRFLLFLNKRLFSYRKTSPYLTKVSHQLLVQYQKNGFRNGPKKWVTTQNRTKMLLLDPLTTTKFSKMGENCKRIITQIKLK